MYYWKQQNLKKVQIASVDSSLEISQDGYKNRFNVYL